MNKHNLARLAVLGTMIAIAPESLRALPDPAPAKPATTAADRARIEAAERKRQMRQAKRLKGRQWYCCYCHDGNDGSIYPYYGVGPHICGWRMGKPVVGHSEGIPASEWPENFQPDPEHGDQDDGKPPLGVWTHCLHCGAGKQKGGA